MSSAVRGKGRGKRAAALAGLMVATAIGGAALSAPAYADDVNGHCTGEGVRIRAAASTDASVVGLCYSDHRLGLRDESGDWVKVYDFDTDVSGWMSRSYWSW
ncbi:SH3 domain-containing protein [Streptomyces sp. NPDC002536]